MNQSLEITLLFFIIVCSSYFLFLKGDFKKVFVNISLYYKSLIRLLNIVRSSNKFDSLRYQKEFVNISFLGIKALKSIFNFSIPLLISFLLINILNINLLSEFYLFIFCCLPYIIVFYKK